MDRQKDVLLDALRQGHGLEEIRLFRSGKLPGLFVGRSSVTTQLAQSALEDGLVELVRSETRGKTTTEWVRVTAKGTQFVVDNESPVKVLESLRDLLKVNGDGQPAWVAELRQRLDEASRRFVDEMAEIRRRLVQTAERVEEALKRLDRMGPPVPEGAAGALPWAHRAVEYLEARRQSSLGERCPLPELFNHLREREPELTLHDFHSGLRRLHDRGLIRLLSLENGQAPGEPEYLLLDGASMYYYVCAHHAQA